jgi:hypothetical protein
MRNHLAGGPVAMETNAFCPFTGGPVTMKTNVLTIPASIGETLDKISILSIKSDRITDGRKLSNVHTELAQLVSAACDHRYPELEAELRSVNEALWDIEDRIRVKERLQEFDDEFVQLARSVYVTNDKRAEIKRRINELSGSALIEEKSYA